MGDYPLTVGYTYILLFNTYPLILGSVWDMLPLLAHAVQLQQLGQESKGVQLNAFIVGTIEYSLNCARKRKAQFVPGPGAETYLKARGALLSYSLVLYLIIPTWQVPKSILLKPAPIQILAVHVCDYSC